MRFTETALPGAFIIDIEPRHDDRGFFARTFCAREFAEHGLPADVAQANLSYNRTRGTLRGMHFQTGEHAETKYVRCTRGAIHDVIVDLRPESPTYLRHLGVDLTDANHRSLFIPRGFAHGFQTLEDDTEVVYQVGAFYAPGHEGGVRYDDPALAIEWPLPVSIISERDLAWGPLVRAHGGVA